MAIGCGGGGSSNPQPDSGPPADGPSSDGPLDPDAPLPDAPPDVEPDTAPGPPIQNDVVNVRFNQKNEADNRTLTASPTDQPDNQATPLTVNTTPLRIDGTADLGGDQITDEYFERDTYLITTGATTTQLSVRLEWDGATSDHDWMLFKEVPAGGELADEVAGGTLIADTGEFGTFAVEPNTNYWLWTGVYQVRADGSTPPTLPQAYDFSLYGVAFDLTGAGINCTFTEAADATNDDLSTDATGTPEVSGQTFDGTAVVMCGNINSEHFDDIDLVVDVDSYTLAVPLEAESLMTLTGPGIEALDSVVFTALNSDGQAIKIGTFSQTGKFGIQESLLPANTASISIFASNGAAIAANLPYKLAINPDNAATRAPRIALPADLVEANDR